MRRVLSVLALALLPAGLFADTLDRMAAANEAMASQMEAFYLSRVPELEGKLPVYTWDAELRAAGTCFLEGYEAERGAAGLEAYVSAMEEWGDVPITSFAQMTTALPPILTEPLPLELSQRCGVVDISLRRAEESGFLDAMSDPSVIERLMAE